MREASCQTRARTFHDGVTGRSTRGNGRGRAAQSTPPLRSAKAGAWDARGRLTSEVLVVGA